LKQFTAVFVARQHQSNQLKIANNQIIFLF